MRSLWIFGAKSSVSDEATAIVRRLFADERDVGFDREDRGRQRPTARHDILAIEPQAVGQNEPAFDAARLVGGQAVMIEKAMGPFAAQFAVMHAADRGLRPCAAPPIDSSSG